MAFLWRAVSNNRSLSGVLLCLALVPFQEPQGPLVARVALVNVDVTVTDARGHFVPDLGRHNFRILDDGADQPITHFASIDAPGVVLVLVETSPAVYLIHRQHLEAAYALLDGLAAGDQVALASYDQSARLLADFTTDKAALADVLGGLHYNLGAGELRFYDAVAAALDWMEPSSGKKALVLLSTGLDTSAGGWQTLAERLRSSEVALYPIGLGGELRDYGAAGSGRRSRTSRAQDDGRPAGAADLSFTESGRVLREMAELTGGRAWFPREPSEFPAIYRQIATTLRHRYSLAFTPPVRDARFHRIEVQLLDDKEQSVGSSNPAGETASDRRTSSGASRPPPFDSAPFDSAPFGSAQGKQGTQGKQGKRRAAARFRLYSRYGHMAPAP
jgi:VWFA-related protein